MLFKICCDDKIGQYLEFSTGDKEDSLLLHQMEIALTSKRVAFGRTSVNNRSIQLTIPCALRLKEQNYESHCISCLARIGGN